MRNKVKRIHLNDLLPLVLFLLFGVCIVTVLLLGARTYRSQIRRDREDFVQRTAIYYLTTRVRQNDGAEEWKIGSFESVENADEGDTLYFYKTIGGETYCTRIYCYNGQLYELFSLANDNSFVREDGEKLLSVESIRFCKKNNGVFVEITWENNISKELYLFQRSNGGT